MPGNQTADNTNKLQPYRVIVPAGGVNPTADFGYVQDPSDPTGMIGNQVLFETDGDGLYEPLNGELGIEGVTVDLYRSGVFYGRTTSGASGDYIFSQLPAGTYTVTVSDVYGVLDGFVVTKYGTAGADDNNQVQPYTVALAGGQFNMTADFGYTRRGAIGDYVWYDADGDGLQDVGEPGIGNVTVALRDPVGAVIAATVTDHDGGYLFDGLMPGTYYVDVTDAYGVLTGYTHTLGLQSQPDPAGPITLAAGQTYREADFGYRQQPPPGSAILGDWVWYDGNGDGIQAPNEPGIPGVQVCATPSVGGPALCATTDSSGQYTITVPAGTYTVAPVVGSLPVTYTATTPTARVTTVVSGQQDLANDFGYRAPPPQNSVVGGTVWHDTGTPDGLLAAGEPGLPSVSVDLIQDTNGNGVWDAGEPIIATATTDASGAYSFTVPSGNYMVLVSNTQNALADFGPTILGPTPGADSNNQAQPYAVSLTPGQTNTTADFGYIKNGPPPPTGFIGNQVWVETDGNGVFNPATEIGVAGVTVALYLGGSLYMTTTTGASGDYVFTGLPAGTYTVTVTDQAGILAGYFPTTYPANQTQDNNNKLQPYQVVLPAGGTNPTADFGYIRAAGLQIAKTPDQQTVVAGSTVTFSIAVTNTGAQDLTNVAVADPQAPNCANTIPSLPVGATTSYLCTLSNVTVSFTNVATGTTTPPVGPPITVTDTARVDVINPAIVITKTPDLQYVLSGGTATFTITVTNSGDVTLTNVSVADPLAPDCVRANLGSLNPSQSTSYTCTVSNVTSQFTNVATGSGQPPVGPRVSSSDDAQVLVIGPSILVIKTPDLQLARSGDTVTFTIAVTNTGDVTLTNVSVADPLAPNCVRPNLGTLNPGQGTSYTCTLSPVTQSFTNVATGSGQPPVGTPVTSTDTAQVQLIDPSIVVIKTDRKSVV